MTDLKVQAIVTVLVLWAIWFLMIPTISAVDSIFVWAMHVAQGIVLAVFSGGMIREKDLS